MKFSLTFKTPDVIDQIYDIPASEDDIEECRKVAEMWLCYGEYITIQFDTEELTAVAVK